jgi:D-alanyl-D-alanine carboxypeptidase/D-alanyl-D-alanine-endopeptidase (penicillin-binding protein 4)
VVAVPSCRTVVCGSLAALALSACGSGKAVHLSMTAPDPSPAHSDTAAVAPVATTATTPASTAATSTATTTTTTASTATTITAATAAASAPLRPPALRHLQAVIVRKLRGSGRQVGVLVYDMTTHQTLFTLNPGVGRPPASVEKLYTTIASATLLGPNATFQTEVLGTGHLRRHGVWHGNLYLRGGGDPTFGDGTFNATYEDGYGPTAAQLVAQLRRRGIRRVTGHVIGDESAFDSLRGGPLTAYRPDIPDYGGELSALVYDHGATAPKLTPPEFAARQLVRTMGSVQIHARASNHSGRTPPYARLLATVSSPPLLVLLRLMDVPSDDLFADLLDKQLGLRFLHEGTLSDGAQVISQAIATGYRLHPTILDGSGLDKADRSSPAQVVALLRDAWPQPVGQLLADSLPIVGETGTVQSIGVHTPAQGKCMAKTGTLNNVTNLAGYCHARGGDLLVFAILIDGPPNWAALTAISPMVGAIAGY